MAAFRGGFASTIAVDVAPAGVVESAPMRSLLLVLAVAACGPKSTTPPPADGPAEPPIDSPPAAECSYTETRDTTNDDVSPATGTPEQTGVTFDQKIVVCGTIDSTHFDDDITVDVDSYVVTLDTAADVLVRLHGAGLETVEFVGLDVYGGAAFDQLAGSVTFYGDHGASAIHLPPGTYEVAAFALAGVAIPASIDYQITIDADVPATRCPSVVGGTTYAETNDGSNNNANDMVTIPSGSPPALTAGADSPEPTGLTIDASSKHRLGGLLADVAVVDQYEDKDTFLITTGDANELAVRLEWNSVANLDYLVFEVDNPEAVKRAATVVNTGPEFQTFSVKPGTAYWLLVGAKTGSSLPTAYSASVCGDAFTP